MISPVVSTSFVEFGGAVEAGVIVHLERQAERVHLLVAGPAIGFPRHAHPLAQRVFGSSGSMASTVIGTSGMPPPSSRSRIQMPRWMAWLSMASECETSQLGMRQNARGADLQGPWRECARASWSRHRSYGSADAGVDGRAGQFALASTLKFSSCFCSFFFAAPFFCDRFLVFASAPPAASRLGSGQFSPPRRSRLCRLAVATTRPWSAVA
jgi:hypothetical protein